MSAAEIDTTALGVGDRFEIPGGVHLTIVGVAPASEAPESAKDAPLYEAELTNAPDTLLYGPHHFDSLLAGDGAYLGRYPRTDERRPFFCGGCEMPARAGERYERGPLTVEPDVCCRGCEKRVWSEQREAKIAQRAGNY